MSTTMTEAPAEDAPKVNHGHFLDPFAPVTTRKTAVGRIRLGAIFGYIAWIAGILFILVLGAGLSDESPDAVVRTGAQAVVTIYFALAIVLPIASTIAMFVHSWLGTVLLVVALTFWVGVRVFSHVTMVVPQSIDIVFAILSIAFTALVALGLVHLVRAQMSLRTFAS